MTRTDPRGLRRRGKGCRIYGAAQHALPLLCCCHLVPLRSFAALSPSQIFEELPIRVHNSHLVQALLLDLLGEAPLPLPVAPAAAAQVAEVALGPAATAAIAGKPAREGAEGG